MILNGKQYKLCLFDTCTLSDFLQNQQNWIKYFDSKFGISNTVICYSAFTLSELWFRQDLFEKYLDTFSAFPSVVIDGHQGILDKEVDFYKHGTPINPIVFSPVAIQEKGLSKKEILKKVITESEFIPKTNYWKNGEEEILKGMLSLIENYPPAKSGYTLKDIEFFNFTVSTSQICLRNRDFAKEEIENKKEIVLDKFQSLRTTSYVVFYKFYTDHRKPQNSDVFDIIISSVLPYVDYFITERNMYGIIRTIQNRHNFLMNLSPIKLTDCKSEF